jgi:PAS domain S-box-containing protein
VLQGSGTNREVLERVRSELAAGGSVQVELLNYRKDGTPYTAELYITPLADASGRRTNYVSVHRDITQRKVIENNLREREERLRTVLETAVDTIITINQSGIIQSVNVAAQRMFGYSEDELVGQNVKILMPTPYREEHDGYLAHYLETHEPRMIGIGREVTGQRKDGTRFPVDLSVSEVAGLNLFTGIIRDATLRKSLQRRVLEIAEEEQRRIGQELHDNTGQELTGLGLFAGTLVDLLQKMPRKDSAEAEGNWLLGDKELAQIRHTAERVAAGVLEANRHVRLLSHGIMPVQIEPDGLVHALDRLASEVNELPGISCQFKCSDPPPVAEKTVSTHLYRIAQEAVSNALQHARSDHIAVALGWDKGHIVLEVRDNGIGLEAAALKKSEESSAERGYGLEIMNHRASLIGGRLNIISEPSAGTRVRCVVPGDVEM